MRPFRIKNIVLENSNIESRMQIPVTNAQQSRITLRRSILSDNHPRGHCEAAPKPMKSVINKAVSDTLNPDLTA